MKYRYPRINNTLTYKKIDQDEIEVTDSFTEEAFIFKEDVARYARKLDGNTHPYKIPSDFTKDETDYIIRYLRSNGLLRRSDTRRLFFGTFLKTLWIPKLTKRLKAIAVLSNLYLMLLWLPVLIAGIFAVSQNLYSINFDYAWIGYIIGLVFGMLFHELGHAFAGIAYGARVYEMGVMVMHFVLPGAYVLLEQDDIKSRFKRIQVNAAGVESNFLLAGVFLLVAAALPSIGGIFLMAAVNNAIMAVLNLTFVKGLDGTAIISEVLGVPNLIEKANNLVFNKKVRQKVLNRGVSGYATAAMCYTLCALQLALPILLVSNVWEVILWFV